MGTIIGCNALMVKTSKTIKDREDQEQVIKTHDKGATHLLKIMISKSAYMIWTLRCARTIRGQEHTQNEIEAAWSKAINRRLSEDRILATKVLWRTPYRNIVTTTWGTAL